MQQNVGILRAIRLKSATAFPIIYYAMHFDLPKRR